MIKLLTNFSSVKLNTNNICNDKMVETLLSHLGEACSSCVSVQKTVSQHNKIKTRGIQIRNKEIIIV